MRIVSKEEALQLEPNLSENVVEALYAPTGGIVTIIVKGNLCPRGELYGKKEIQTPTRMVTSTIRVKNGEIPMASVKTKEDIHKNRIFDVMKVIKAVTVEAPVRLGDVVIKNFADTGVDIVATKTVNRIDRV